MRLPLDEALINSPGAERCGCDPVSRLSGLQPGRPSQARPCAQYGRLISRGAGCTNACFNRRCLLSRDGTSHLREAEYRSNHTIAFRSQL
jgi:hypothetical protein